MYTLHPLLCDEFCHNYTNSKAIEIMENKEKTRMFLKDQPYTPKFLFIQPGEAVSSNVFNSQLEFPVIVKSPKSTGSKDVLFARGKEQLIKQIQVSQ